MGIAQGQSFVPATDICVLIHQIVKVDKADLARSKLLLFEILKVPVHCNKNDIQTDFHL
jgi:hypothetical protein